MCTTSCTERSQDNFSGAQHIWVRATCSFCHSVHISFCSALLPTAHDTRGVLELQGMPPHPPFYVGSEKWTKLSSLHSKCHPQPISEFSMQPPPLANRNQKVRLGQRRTACYSSTDSHSLALRQNYGLHLLGIFLSSLSRTNIAYLKYVHYSPTIKEGKEIQMLSLYWKNSQ